MKTPLPLSTAYRAVLRAAPAHGFAFLPAALVLAVVSSLARADTFSYDDAGRLLAAASTVSGLNHGYTYDEEANLLTITHGATDTATVGAGSGNGLPDWWEQFYFGARAQNPLVAPTSDGLSRLLKFALGQSPQVPASSAALTKYFELFTDGKSYPMLSFVRAKDAAAMLAPEQSIGGGAWQGGASYFAAVSITDLGDGTERVVVRSLTPLPVAANLAFRLKAADAATGVNDATAPIPASTGVPTMPGWSFVLLTCLLLAFAVGRLRQKTATAAHTAS